MNRFILVFAVLALLVAVGSPAQAAPVRLSFETSTDGLSWSVPTIIVDNVLGGGDTSALANFLVANNPSDFGIGKSTATAFPVSGEIAKLTLASTNLTSISGGYLRITASNSITSTYSGQAWAFSSLTGALNGGSISVQNYVETAANGKQGAFDLDDAGGAEPATASGASGPLSTSFAFTDTTAIGPLALGETISLITEATIYLSAGGSGALTLDGISVKSVPEPTSLLLMSFGVTGMAAAAARRRKNRRKEPVS